MEAPESIDLAEEKEMLVPINVKGQMFNVSETEALSIIGNIAAFLEIKKRSER